MKILITGGAGFIGYHLALELLESYNTAEIVLVDNLRRGKIDVDMKNLLLDSRIRFLNLDLTNKESYKMIGGGYDHVYHLAAVNGTASFYEVPHEVLRINTLSLIYILEWLVEVNPNGKFCFTSSNEAYAGGLIAFHQMKIPTPENVPLVIENTYNPRWSYGGSKLIGELFVIHYAQHFNLKAVIVRPHNFYGPRAGFNHVIPEFSLRIMKREDPFIIYGDTDTRAFCYIQDAVEAMRMIMDSNKTNILPIQTVHIGDKREITIKELANEMFSVTNWRPLRVESKNGLNGSVPRRLADISKLENMTGWEPKTVLADGLLTTYNWYSSFQDLNK